MKKRIFQTAVDNNFKEVLNYFSILITEICITRLLSYEGATKEADTWFFKKYHRLLTANTIILIICINIMIFIVCDDLFLFLVF